MAPINLTNLEIQLVALLLKYKILAHRPTLNVYQALVLLEKEIDTIFADASKEKIFKIYYTLHDT